MISSSALRLVVASLSLFLVLINTFMLVCTDDLPCTQHHVTIPRDCQSGRLLLSLEYVGQTFHMSTAAHSSRHFAVLANGDVICAAVSGSPDVGTVSFGVECRLGLLAWTELIHATVVDDSEILVSFTQPYFEGRVVENAPSNSVIDGLHNISVYLSNFQGRVLADVGQPAVDSSTLGLVADDDSSQTSGKVKFSVSESAANMFHLVSNGDGSVALRTLVELDFERQSQYLLLVVAVVPRLASTASARLRVYVDNINDHAPTLDRTEYYFRLDETARPEVVPDMRVTAFDADDDQLTYTIDGKDADEFFFDPYSGEIYFRHPATQRRRDYELRVYADDGLHRSDPGVVRVRVDGKDQDPDEVEQSRTRRDVRPLRLVEVPENMIGDVIDIGTSRRHEFFSFKEPAPAYHRSSSCRVSILTINTFSVCTICLLFP